MKDDEPVVVASVVDLGAIPIAVVNQIRRRGVESRQSATGHQGQGCDEGLKAKQTSRSPQPTSVPVNLAWHELVEPSADSLILEPEWCPGPPSHHAIPASTYF